MTVTRHAHSVVEHFGPDNGTLGQQGGGSARALGCPQAERPHRVSERLVSGIVVSRSTGGFWAGQRRSGQARP